MTNINQTTDFTGAMSQTDLNAADINTIVDEFNKLQDQLTGGNIHQSQQAIIVFDNSTNRVLIGYQIILQQWGLFVSQIGVDVTQATADQLIFNSNQDTFKIVKILQFTDTIGSSVTAPAGGFATNFHVIGVQAHGQTFAPAILAYYGTTTGYGLMPHTDYYSFVSSQAGWFTYDAIADATNVTVSVKMMGYGSTIGVGPGSTFRVFVLQETAALT